VIIDALARVTRIDVVSAPKLLVLNNQTATLQVGDEVPVATQSAVSVISPGAPVVNSIEFRDTGVILKVTPRVNGNGEVLLDISQEVSSVVKTTTSDLDSPTIHQRRIVSSVAVRSGDTIALGGLISDNRTATNSGIPLLKDVPYLGNLFKTTDITGDRTELLVFITPRVSQDNADNRRITEELRREMKLLQPIRRQGG
jgi:general secretion pathway protein D